MLKFVVVGTGRCGTGLLSKMFNDAGVACGHENIIYSHDENVNMLNFKHNKQYCAESSWAAAPFLAADWFDKDIKIIHLVRHPMEVIRSFYEINFFSAEREQKPLNKLVYLHTDIKPDNLDRLVSSVEHYFQWNRIIEQQLDVIDNPSKLIRLDNLKSEVKELNQFLGINLSYTSDKVNQKTSEKSSEHTFDRERVKSIILNDFSSYNFYGYEIN